MNNLVSNATLPPKKTHVRHQLAVILLITLMIAYIDRVNVSMLIVDKSFLAAMGIADDPIAKGSLMSVFLICYGIGNIALSPVGDWLGPRKAMLISIFMWSLSLLLGGFATCFAMMIVSRIMLGIGESMHWPMQSKFISNWFPAQERGKANATWLIGTNMAPLIAMPLFNWMIPLMGWRENFYCLAAMGILPLFLIWKYTADHPYLHKYISKAERDYIETELQKETKEKVKTEKANVWVIVKEILADYRFWLMTIGYVGITTIWWGTISWLPAYLKEVRGFSWAAMGGFSTLPYILCVVVKLFSGYACDKVGRSAPFLVVSLFGSAVFIYMAVYATSNVMAAVLLSFGISFATMASPPIWVLLQNLVPARSVGTASGIMSGIGSGISAIAPIAIGILIAFTGSYIGGLMYLVGWGVLSAAACSILAFQRL